MIIFVSHPFTGDKERNRWDAERITENLQRSHPKITFINPLEILRPLDGLRPEFAILAACMNLIKGCDAVLQCDGWEKSAGCRAEAAFAVVHDIPRIDLADMDILKKWGL